MTFANDRDGGAQGPAGALAVAPHAVCPLDISVETIGAFLNCEFADHPVYDGIELQAFDDPQHGTGMLAFLSRRGDRSVDFYVDPGLTLDPSTFAIGAGIGSWSPAVFDVARLEVHSDGVAAEVRFRDGDGRLVEVAVNDRNGRVRRRGAMLAPVSAAIDAPTSLLLVYMTQFDLVRTTSQPPSIRIDGEAVRVGALPGVRLHRRHLIKYARDLVAVRVNRDRAEGAVVAAGAVVECDASGDIATVTATAGEHAAVLALQPAMPRPASLADVAGGTWFVSVDEARLTGGTWSATRHDDEVVVALDVTERWRPHRLPLLMRIVTIVIPTFRRWPPTYRWRARIRPGATPAITSSWERTGDGLGEAYRRATGT